MRFLLFFFFIPSISFSKIITLKDCRYSWESTFQKDLYEENKIVINSDNKTITHYIILTDEYIKDNKQLNEEIKKLTPQMTVGFPKNKINKFEYKISHSDTDKNINEIQIFKGHKENDKVTINLKEMKIEQSFLSPITKKEIKNNIYCNIFNN